ncbi:Hypothetical protein R9X50_00447500 [Acrodontium crateriforme]|uniref:Mitochondrial carrier n=1 Tax=Acrodontium crateriforme TaxID=150365 RepID=A0AAQ3R535_9PEZI|nr:Hypothetical protein R9X50_00447500 [Acrodontium crateriforme]
MNIGVLPVELGEDGKPRKKRQDNASTGASAATMRALTARIFAFYFRAPMKSFFRTRVDYMGYARAINPGVKAGERWSWRMTSPALLASAVQHHGWSFLPNQVLPPLLANTLVGAVLYTGYLQILGLIHEPSSKATKRVDPLPPPPATFTAAFLAGAVQSLIAAPLDALQIRFQAAEMMAGKYTNTWQYAFRKTREIGARGIFAGWSLSLVRDSFGAAAFFSAFEYIKGQAFYAFVSNYYGTYAKLTGAQKDHIAQQESSSGRSVIKPYYLIEPAFILGAGIAASIAQAAVHWPISRIQELHYGRLEWIDAHPVQAGTRRGSILSIYTDAYRKTFKQCSAIARREGGLRRWLYRGFIMGTIRTVPSTSAGLIVFEVFRRKYSNNQDEVRIQKDGYDILLV